MKKYFILTSIAVALLALSFTVRKRNIAKPENRAAFNIDIQPYSPKELRLNASPEELCSFAWNEFFALTWKSNYNQKQKRGLPDTDWTPAKDKGKAYPDDPLVWETYRHRVELRPYHGAMQPFDYRPSYSYAGSVFFALDVNINLFNNLDENNEIGSCTVYAHAGTDNRKYQVLYQAKVNRDEYEYVLKNYPTKESLKQANINTFNNITKDSAYYRGATGSCNCDPAQKVICLPCGNTVNPETKQPYEGAMEVKTAWRKLKPNENAARYFIRTVITYTSEVKNGKKRLVALNERYALIGLHIIHKTQNYPNFVFATFEHVDAQDSDMGYYELDANGNEVPPLYDKYPRLHPITAVADQSTQAAIAKLKTQNPQSVWQYYRLTGVQAQTTNDQSSFNYFLANYVVESDSALANFRGSSLADPFDGKVNVLYKGKGYVMGGCQGCHGVAQVKFGSDCSFVLDTVGKPVAEPDFGSSSQKLVQYIRAFKRADLIRRGLPVPAN